MSSNLDVHQLLVWLSPALALTSALMFGVGAVWHLAVVSALGWPVMAAAAGLMIPVHPGGIRRSLTLRLLTAAAVPSVVGWTCIGAEGLLLEFGRPSTVLGLHASSGEVLLSAVLVAVSSALFLIPFLMLCLLTMPPKWFGRMGSSWQSPLPLAWLNVPSLAVFALGLGIQA